jgi:ketosteroid isomerase-like protein
LRANAGDVEGLVALYESEAVLACPHGRVVVGSKTIRGFYSELLSEKPTFEPGEQQPALRRGDLVLTSSRLANGVVTAEIARRQADGTWLCAIDQPSIAKMS